MSTYESMELVGMSADELDNLLAATKIPMPVEIHFEALVSNLSKIRDRLRQVYVLETGDNPWA